MSSRTDFDPSRPVQLLQMCFTGTELQVLYPGTYDLAQIPDAAFIQGIVKQAPLPVGDLAPNPSTPASQPEETKAVETKHKVTK